MNGGLVKLGSQVSAFHFMDIPMVGNRATGDVIGLSDEGWDLCCKLASNEGLPEGDPLLSQQTELVEHLAMGGFFNESRLRTLESAYLHVTQRCNLSCVGCYSAADAGDGAADMSLDEMVLVVGQLARAGVRCLNLSGGEPFLRRDLPLLVRAARTSGIEEVCVLTNGTVPDADMIQELAPVVSCVSVSFDGPDASAPAWVRGTQRFPQLAAFVGQLRSAGIPVVLTTTVHGKNLEDLPRYQQVAHELGAQINFSLLSPPTGGPATLGSLAFDDEGLRQAAMALWALSDAGGSATLTDEVVGAGLLCRDTCGAGCKTISVGADGTVYPCHMMHDERFALGNLRDRSLEDILRNGESQTFAKFGVEDLDECASCAVLPFCGGGCRARAVAAGHGLRGRDAYCALAQTYYGEAGRRLKDMLSERS